jgi:hypothetical protein
VLSVCLRRLSDRFGRQTRAPNPSEAYQDLRVVLFCKFLGSACHPSEARTWSFYILSGGGTADELVFGDFDLEFFQEFGVFGHFLA